MMRIFYVLLIILVPFNSYADLDNATVSDRLFDGAKNLFMETVAIHSEMVDAEIKHCPVCKIYEEVCVAKFSDVILILEKVISLDREATHAKEFLAQIYWMTSYEGKGFGGVDYYDNVDLELAYELLKDSNHPLKTLVQKAKLGMYSEGGCLIKEIMGSGL